MQKTIDELAILFNKIESGEATEEERLDYDLGIGISCVKEEILRAKPLREAWPTVTACLTGLRMSGYCAAKAGRNRS